MYQIDVPAPVGDLIIRAIQSGQRVFEVPDRPADANVALVELRDLVTLLNLRLSQLEATAGSHAQAPLRARAEQHLNIPVRVLLDEIDDVYDADFG